MLDAPAFAHWSPAPPAVVDPPPGRPDDETLPVDGSEGAPVVESSGPLDVDGAETAAEGDDEPMTAGDFSILASPTISLPAFGTILRGAGSPAAPEYIGIYNAAVSYGVDPAVLLAIYQHESNFGKAGVAVRTKGIGNLRFYPASAAMGATRYQTANNGSFASYSSYTLAAADTARLLASSLYGRSTTHNTVRTFPFRWAPAADHNKPAAYGASLAANIARWTGKSGSAFKPAPAHPAAKPASAAAHAVKAATVHVKAAPAKIATAASSVMTGAGAGSLPIGYLYAALAIGGAMLLLLLVLGTRKRKAVVVEAS